MPRKRQPHDTTVSMRESQAYIVPLDEVIATKKFAKLFRDKILTKYSLAQAHLIAHFLDTFPLSREAGKAVPLPYNVLWKKFPSLYKDGELQQLLDDGIFDRDYFSQSDHKCYYYTAGHTLLAWLEEDKRETYIASLLHEPLVRLVDGQKAASLKHLLFDHEGKTIPELNKQALAALKTNIINYQELDWELTLLARDSERGDYRQRQRPRLKVQIITSYIRSILRQKHWTISQGGRPLLVYVPAYKGSRFGRLFERGGGMQAMPKALKQVAYDFLSVHAYNYDVRSCHIAIIAQLCREEGHPFPVLEEYVSHKDAKQEYARKAQMDVPLWKACIISLFYGSQLGKNRHFSLYRDMWEAYEAGDAPYTEADVDRTYEHFLNVGLPFIQARQVWLEVLKDKIVPRLTDKKNFVMNQVGCTKMIPDAWTVAELRAMSSFVCIGYEAAFIDHLMTLHEAYGWENRSIEHDGLITQGRIPEEAIAKARNLSAFYTASLEEAFF